MFSTYIVLCYLKFIYIVLHLHVTSYTLTQCVKNIVKLIYTYIQWSFACSRIEIFAKLTYIPLPGLNFQKPKYPYPICIFSDFFFIYSYLGDVRNRYTHPTKLAYTHTLMIHYPGLRNLRRIYILTRVVLNFF